MVLLFHAAPSIHKGHPIIWVVLVYFKHVCICSLIGTPPKWGWGTLPPWWVSWLTWGLCFPVLGGTSRERDLLRIHGGAIRSCTDRWTHPTWPMMGIPVITPIGLQESAQHHLHAAEGLKLELPRAGTTVHPSLLDFGQGGFGHVGSHGSGMGLCILHLSAWVLTLLVMNRGGFPTAGHSTHSWECHKRAAAETTKSS